MLAIKWRARTGNCWSGLALLARRRVGGAGLRRPAVSQATDRSQLVTAVAKLRAQAANVNVHRARTALVERAPDGVQELVSAQCAAGVLDEVAEQGKLLGGELQRLFTDLDRAGREVEVQRARSQDGFALGPGLSEAFGAGAEFRGGEPAHGEVGASELRRQVQLVGVQDQQPRNAGDDRVLCNGRSQAFDRGKGRGLYHHQVWRQGDGTVEISAAQQARVQLAIQAL